MATPISPCSNTTEAVHTAEEEDAVESAWAGDAPQEKTVNDEMHEYFAGLFP